MAPTSKKDVYKRQELDQLTSEEIKSVEVVRNPGARYDATVGAVVRIRTVKRQGDGLSLIHIEMCIRDRC